MKIDVMGFDGNLSQALRGSVVRRVLLALSRFGPRLLRVTVRLAEPANPLGGVDQRCRMRAWLQASEDVRAEAINGRIEVAVGRAATRLANRVAWALDGASSDHSYAALGAPERVHRLPAPRAETKKPGRRSEPSGPGRRTRS
jgi:hypothetical protein